MSEYFHYWGKASPAGDAAARCHLLPYHCLDVAACGVMLLRLLPRWRQRLEALTSLQGEELELFVWVFLALHDLGKFATGFQNLRPDLLEGLQNRRSDKGYTIRHDTLGYLLWRNELRGIFIQGGHRRRCPTYPGLDAWMRAVTGHHGQPPEESRIVLRDVFDLPADREAAEGFVRAVLDLAGLEAFPAPSEGTGAISSWWLAGLTVLADWLGSNADFFPYRDEIVPLDEYWQTALKQAKRAIGAAGLDPSPPVERFRLADCFVEAPPQLSPTPLQHLAETLPLASGPGLFILEDVTGSGKTEAALILAQRLLKLNGGGGLYFGLPTMATANGMYQRLAGMYSRLFAHDACPSLVLAHGHADLLADFRATVLPPPTPEADYGDDTEPAGARCSAWLADSRKKALLAEVGVGTVDQTLLAVLPSRHQSLRLLGLLDKVLIVDEVHACDAYMNRLLERLLRAHARAGGSAILLSATLPSRQRESLLRAFAEGAGWAAPETEPADDYPLATYLHTGGLEQHPLATRPAVARRVEASFVDDEKAVENLLDEAMAAGRCACWIANTVNDACRRFENLRQTHPDWNLHLFHARFTLADRLAIEERVLECFGKASGPKQRRGQVLIATQVVEQSLDLDFDVLISDLAPIDLLIQRAGRLQRHSRDEEGRRIDGPDRRGDPRMIILAPPWNDTPDARWLGNALPGTAAVYESEDGRSWLTMKLLRDKGDWNMPEDARELIEGVYGADPFMDFPEGLQGKALEAEGLMRGKSSIAGDKALDLDMGYRLDGPWLDEDSAPTRLGEPTTTAWLARLKDGRLLPLHGDCSEDTEAWMQSALTLRRNLACREVVPAGIPEGEWLKLKSILPGRGKWGVAVVVSQAEDGWWHGSVLDERGQTRSLRYASSGGLQWETHQ